MSESYSPQGAQDFYYDFWGQVSEPEPEAEQPDAEYNASHDLFVVLKTTDICFVLVVDKNVFHA
ncbi:hypothetical protein DPMN_063575 [Dreissena polymorpha]|uniref:Uncharacterized protein n=1 Tax=Dreissena polymorpha TaxID=45954 RepID=A0A9D4CAS1_DREPO|nr:hypothetical protein DPMN_063575 [Dreissena polymorpha]